MVRFIVYIIFGMAVLGAMFTWLQQTGDLDAILEHLDSDRECTYNRHTSSEQNPVAFRERQGKYVAQDPDHSPISIELAHKARPALIDVAEKEESVPVNEDESLPTISMGDINTTVI